MATIKVKARVNDGQKNQTPWSKISWLKHRFGEVWDINGDVNKIDVINIGMNCGMRGKAVDFLVVDASNGNQIEFTYKQKA